jgi:BirA family biotin operon repressor/biotin-[acetyl-CoA-carboxylase] ligase
MSVLLFPPPELAPAVPEAAFGCAWLTAMGAVATAEVVSACIGRDATIKWPNDVRVDGRKIAGILVERVMNPVVVIGIGLNVNLDREAFPTELRTRATSLRIECSGPPLDRSGLARDLIRRLDYWYDASRSLGCQTLNAPWRARSEHLGRYVRIATPAGPRDGRLTDLDVELGLTLALEEGRGPEDRGLPAPQVIRFPFAEILALHPEPLHEAPRRSLHGRGSGADVLLD